MGERLMLKAGGEDPFIYLHTEPEMKPIDLLVRMNLLKGKLVRIVEINEEGLVVELLEAETLFTEDHRKRLEQDIEDMFVCKPPYDKACHQVTDLVETTCERVRKGTGVSQDAIGA